MCFLSLQFSPRPKPPNRDIAVRSLPYPPPKRGVQGKHWPEPPDGSIVVRSLPYPPLKRGVGEALAGTAGREHRCSLSPVPAAEARSRGSVGRKCRTEALLFVLSHIRRRSAEYRGSIGRNRRTEALPFVLSRIRRRCAGDRGSVGRNRRTEALPFVLSRIRRRNAGIGEVLSGTAGRKHCCSLSPVSAAGARG